MASSRNKHKSFNLVKEALRVVSKIRQGYSTNRCEMRKFVEDLSAAELITHQCDLV